MEFGAGKTFVQKHVGCFHFTVGLREESYEHFVPDLELESRPADPDQIWSLAPSVSNKGIHVNFQVRHSQVSRNRLAISM